MDLTPATSVLCFLFVYSSGEHVYVHSFPTRRSSDLPGQGRTHRPGREQAHLGQVQVLARVPAGLLVWPDHGLPLDRKSTRLNSSHRTISYAVFCLKKKKCAMSKLQKRVRQPYHGCTE